MRRCIRTRDVGRRIFPVAHAAGVRHLAMEALFPGFAEQCNRTRGIPNETVGYLAQPDMQLLIQTALDLGWTLLAYEADHEDWLAVRHADWRADDQHNPTQHQEAMRTEMLSHEYTQWRDEQQAHNIIALLNGLPDQTPLLVWCGNGHLCKTEINGWRPMGYQLARLAGSEPFVIDQTRTIKFGPQQADEFDWARQFSAELLAHEGTAALLAAEVRTLVPLDLGADAFVLSLDNNMV